MTQVQLDLHGNRMLLADWFAKLADEAGCQFDTHSGHSTAGSAFTFVAPNEWSVTAKFIEAHPFLQFISSDEGRQQFVDGLAQRALARVKAADLGGINWYSAFLDAQGFQLGSPFWIRSMMQQLGAQTRIVGWRRLGCDILIEFAEEIPADWDEKNVLLAPKAIIHVYMAIPGPNAGFFLHTSLVARQKL